MANTDYGAILLTTCEATSQALNHRLGVSTGFKPSEWAENINLLGRLPKKTVSGSVCHFTDGVSLPLVNGKFGITAYQEGTGTPSPSNVRAIHGYTGMDIVRAGKNLLPALASSFETNGIKWDLNADGSIHVHGTATGNSTYDFGRGTLSLKTGSYFVNETGNSVNVVVYKNTSPASIIKSGGGAFSITEDNTPVFVRFNVANGTTLDTTIYLQLEIGKEATAYSAYNGTTYPLTWQTECFGGYIDYKRGKKVTNGLFHTISSSDALGGFQEHTNAVTCYLSLGASNLPLSVSGGYVISNRFSNTFPSGTAGRIVNSTTVIYFALPKDELSTLDLDGCKAWFADHATDIVYELASPTEEDIILPVISVLDGENNVWNTCGDSEVRYMASSASTTIGFSSECTGSWNGTDDERTVLTISASDKTTVNFNTGMTATTNCGSNDGYIAVYKNSTQVFKKMLTTGATVSLGSLPSMSLEEGDIATVRFGFANSHTNIRMYLYNGTVEVGGVASVTGIVGVTNTNTKIIGITT